MTRRHCLLFLLLVCAVWAEADVAKLAWAGASEGGCRCTSLAASSTVLTTPAVYVPPMGEAKIFVKRYMTKGVSSATHHVVMLPGGPGQDETVLEGHVQPIADMLGGSVALYLVDMRGVGQSQSFVMPNDMSCLTRLDQLASTAPIPVQALSLSNAARDVIELGKAIRASPEFAKGSTLHVYGVSFGADWAYRTLQHDNEGIFSTALLDSIAAFDGLIEPANDEPMLENCDAHPFCREQFGGAAKNARTMMREILDGDRNACTAKLAAAFGSNKFWNVMSPEYKLQYLLQPLLEGDKPLGGRYHSGQLALAFIKATHSCHEPGAYDAILAEVLDARGAGTAKGAPPGAMNMLINALLFMGEAYNFPGGGNATCGPPSITHHCMLYFAYGNTYENVKRYVTPRDPIHSQIPQKAKLFFVHGEFDIVTPVRPAEALARRCGARMLKYRNQGHAFVSGGECAQPIWREAVLGEGGSVANGCLNTVNSVPLDWTFKHIPMYRAWFDPSVDAVATYIADAPAPSLGGGMGAAAWTAVAVAVLAIAGGAAVYVFKARAAPK